MRRMTMQQFEANVRRQERERAAADMSTAIRNLWVQLKQPLDACLQREKEHKEVINKLQEQEKNGSALVQTLTSKLTRTEQLLVISESKVHQLETQISKEQKVSASTNRRVKELETNIQRIRKELEIQKVISIGEVRQLETQIIKEQQESASKKRRMEELETEIQRTKIDLESKKALQEVKEAKISELELIIKAAVRDLDFERKNLEGCRKKIMHLETQLCAFGLTTEKIKPLFAKQQETLKAMQEALEDKESYQNASIDAAAEPNQTTGINGNWNVPNEGKDFI